MDKSKSVTFERLEIWKLAQDLAQELSQIFYIPDFRNYSFQDQIMRAVISISNNIAEGFGRGSSKEFIRFLYISKGSCEEVKSMLYLSLTLNYINSEQKELLIKDCVNLSVKINNLIRHLSKSEA